MKGVVMAKAPAASLGASDDAVRELLDRYKCPVPFHAVRTRFLGNIASPAMAASPIDMVKQLWGGELPIFDHLDEANALFSALVMGLWNRLTRHQDRSAPFRLARPSLASDRSGHEALARIRRQELDGFVEGLFGESQELDLPERAHRALQVLSEIRAMIAGLEAFAADASKPASVTDISVTARHLREFTRIAEHEMHEAVLSCTRARRQALDVQAVTKPTLH
jgi:hypothetical protein